MISFRNVYLRKQLSIKNQRKLSDTSFSKSKLDPKVGSLASRLGTSINPSTSAASPKNSDLKTDRNGVENRWSRFPSNNQQKDNNGDNNNGSSNTNQFNSYDNRNKFSSSTASSAFTRSSVESNQPIQPSKFKFSTPSSSQGTCLHMKLFECTDMNICI